MSNSDIKELVVDFDLDYLPGISYLPFHVHIPVIRKVSISNQTDQSLTELTLSIAPSDDFSSSFKTKIANLNPGETMEVKDLKLKLKGNFFATLTEMELHKSGKSSNEISRELGIPADIVRRWSREYKNSAEASFAGNGKPVMTAEQREIAQLKKALKEAEIERDILKKAVGIFSKSDNKYSGS